MFKVRLLMSIHLAVYKLQVLEMGTFKVYLSVTRGCILVTDFLV